MKQDISPIRLLVVEDDDISREIVATHLVFDGFKVAMATSVESGNAEFRRGNVDLAIVDINLPDGSGFDLVRQLRKHRDCAVIYMTSRSEPSDRVRGLEAGGDDYIVKPAHLAELSARVRAVLRRYQKSSSSGAGVIALSGSTLDLVRRELADEDGQLVPLTRGEFDIFSALVQASPVSLDRDYLLEVLTSADSTVGIRTIDVMISRIRAKITPARLPFRIVTTRGSGYRIEDHAI